MKILMITPRFPYPPDRGDRLRWWSELEFLARRHEVWLASADTRRPGPAHLDVVRRCCRDVAVFTRPGIWCLARAALRLSLAQSATAGYCFDRRLARRVRRWSSQVGFGAVLTCSSAMTPYAELVSARRFVLDMADVDSVKWRVYATRSRWPFRALYSLEARRLARLERHCVRHHDICVVVNERERRKLLEGTCPRATGVLRTCVDPAQYTCLNALPESRAPVREPVIGMVGSMFYPPNVRAVNWFGRYVWPLVRAARPDARWLIVGARPTRAVRAWGRQPQVTVTGYVPDIVPHLARMRVFVDPVEGHLGVQSKVIVALAAGRPVVVTPDGAAGIDYGQTPPFLIAGSPGGFAEAVLRLLEDDGLASKLAELGRRVVAANYRAETQLGQLEHWLSAEAAVAADVLRHSAAPAAGAVRRAPRHFTVGAMERRAR